MSGWAGIYLEFGPENRDSALTAAAATRPVKTRPVLSGAWLGLGTGLGLERFYLVMEFEQRVVYRQLVPLEPLHEAAHEGEPVDGHRHRHGAGCVRGWKEEECEGAVLRALAPPLGRCKFHYWFLLNCFRVDYFDCIGCS